MSISTVETANLAKYQAAKQNAATRVTGSASANLTAAEFYTLITTQLQYQDPMEPTSNAEFVTQTTQMSQLTATQSMNSTYSEMQASSLVGQNVTVYDPTDKTNKKTITGNVTSASLSGEKSTITINDQQYPLSKLKTINAQVAKTGTPSSTPANGTPSSTPPAA